jgi:indolepyruvate ferredoxin oxidoreductase, alpha subunit
VVSSYPGSPTPEIANTIQSIPQESRPFYFEYSVNEKVATEVAFGAAVNGNLSCVFFKSVGLNVALDTFVTSGLIYLSLLDVYDICEFQPDILKLGAINPLEKEIVLSFLKSHDDVLILEELDDILEPQIKSIAYDHQLTTKITGKVDDEDFVGEYTPDKVSEKLSVVWPNMIVAVEGPYSEVTQIEVPARPAQMCPGCGHRSAFFAIKKALENEDVTVADIGCHTLGYMPPYNVGKILMCMGASTGMASGLSLFNDKKRVVAFLGQFKFANHLLQFFS